MPPGGVLVICLPDNSSIVQIQCDDLGELDVGVAHMDLLRFGRAALGGGEGHVAEDDPLFRLGFIHRFRATVYALENASGGEQPHTFASGYLVVLNDVPHSNFTPFAVLPYHSIILARLQTAGGFFLQR